MGLSLWLVPNRDIAAKLGVIMKMKTSTSKSPSSFPHFEPHITLATVPSSTSVSDLQAAIPTEQVSIPIAFKGVVVGTKCFMSVYVTVRDDGELSTLRDVLRKALGEATVPPVAHVSLFYIDDSEPDERVKINEELKRAGRIVEHGAERVALDCAPSGSKVQELVDGFQGSEIWIALCDGPIETWTVKEKITLR